MVLCGTALGLFIVRPLKGPPKKRRETLAAMQTCAITSNHIT